MTDDVPPPDAAAPAPVPTAASAPRATWSNDFATKPLNFRADIGGAFGSLQVVVMRPDHRRVARADIGFKVAELHTTEGRERVRAEAHASLDALIDRMGLPE